MKAIIGNQEKYSDDVKRALNEVLLNADEFKAVVIVGLQKDGAQKIIRSLCSFEEVCFLKCFMDSWVFEWFKDQMVVHDGK